MPASASVHASAPAVTKHPAGLRTLFFTEMWERFSYYGMRALLVLFMVDSVQKGGLGMDDKTATAVYGLYTAFAYLASLPGGWVGDRLLGAQRAVWVGGIVIAAGHFTLAAHSTYTFFLGLILIIVGTALLKPNMSVLVGSLYPEGGSRRDAGYTIFYMGVNLGAAIGPLICSWLGERFNWHYGFAAAGVGMVAGLIQFRYTRDRLGNAGVIPPGTHGDSTRPWTFVAVGLAILIGAVVLAMTGVLKISPIALAQKMAFVIVGIGAIHLAALFAFGGLDREEKKRVGGILVLLVASAVFWSGFEQAGSSLNLFAERYTQRAFFGFEIPAGWFQSLNPVFIITLAPLFAALWVRLAARGRDLSIPAKFAMALLLLAGGFLVIAVAARVAATGGKVLPTWLLTTYLINTVGEICLSPVGLSAVSKLAPARYAGQMMGLWFLATSLGNLLAGLFAGHMSAENAGQMPALYQRIAWISIAAAVGLLAALPFMKRLFEHQENDPRRE